VPQPLGCSVLAAASWHWMVRQAARARPHSHGSSTARCSWPRPLPTSCLSRQLRRLAGGSGGGGGGVGMHVLPGKRAGPGRRTCAARVQQPRWQPPCACRAALRRTRGRPGSDPAERARCGGQVHKARLRQARGARAPRGWMAGGGRPLGWRAPPRGAPGRAAGAAGAGGRHGGGAGARDSDGAIAGSAEAAEGEHAGGVGNGARGGLPQAWRLRSGQEPALGSAAGERARAHSSGARLGIPWGCGCVCRQAASCCLARRALACLPMDRAALAANDAQGVHSSYIQGPGLTGSCLLKSSRCQQWSLRRQRQRRRARRGAACGGRGRCRGGGRCCHGGARRPARRRGGCEGAAQAAPAPCSYVRTLCCSLGLARSPADALWTPCFGGVAPRKSWWRPLVCPCHPGMRKPPRMLPGVTVAPGAAPAPRRVQLAAARARGRPSALHVCARRSSTPTRCRR